MRPAATAGRLVPLPALGGWVIGAVALAVVLAGLVLTPELRAYPRDWTVPAAAWIGEAMRWITGDTPLVEGLPTIKDVTRALAGVLGVVLDALRALIADGFRFTPGDGPFDLPPIPWFAIVAAAAVAAQALGGRRLTLLTVLGLLFLAVTGNWRSSMTTLASVLIAGTLAAALGLALGILASRSRRAERAVMPVLDLMQTVPVFSYLVPVLVLFGFGPVAAMTATIIYATPPMVRTTMLGIARVPPEIVEFGRMAGCNERQLLARVLLPVARPSLMLGLNQVIMMTLNMVIIASMIGAGGLGYDVLVALRRLDIGGGLEGGLAIVVLAMLLDRFSQEAATATASPAGAEVRRARRRTALVVAALLGLGWLAALAWPSIAGYPQDWVVTGREPLNELARWINVNLYEPLNLIKTAVLLGLMVPVKTFLLTMPWFTPPLLAFLAGLALGGVRLALKCGLMILAIMLVGLQAPAMTSLYLCGLGVVLATVLGIPLGVWGAGSDRAHRVLMAIGDVLQTMPAFVYLIPVVMLFRVGDFSALVAIVLFAIVPIVRYTDFGIRAVPPGLVEAGAMNGCTPRQILWRVRLPVAVPEILLGLNQTIMMALSMLVITALVGTRDLGQETYIALTKADTGRGLVAGLAIAFIAMTADRLIGKWAESRRRALGLA